MNRKNTTLTTHFSLYYYYGYLNIWLYDYTNVIISMYAAYITIQHWLLLKLSFWWRITSGITMTGQTKENTKAKTICFSCEKRNYIHPKWASSVNQQVIFPLICSFNQSNHVSTKLSVKFARVASNPVDQVIRRELWLWMKGIS